MRFVQNGPNIPEALIAAQERGDVVFLCGAGVSCTAGLPSFRQLVESVYAELGETWVGYPAEASAMEREGIHFGQYDRALRGLERRISYGSGASGHHQRAAHRQAVSQHLAVPRRANLENQKAILSLSRDEHGRSRVVTTNFDTSFERAWLKMSTPGLSSHAGPAMPPSGSPLFEGIFHIHGRLSDGHTKLRLPQTELVLTSVEFGDAYLRSGRAARYVYDLARSTTIVMVGYRAVDPPMRYLLEVLDADRERFSDIQEIYAFAPFDSKDPQGELWRAKGIVPVTYGSEISIDHLDCYKTLQEWGRYAQNPTHWRTERLRAIIETDPNATSEDAIAEAITVLGHGDASIILAGANPNHNWVSPLVSRDILLPARARPELWLEKRFDQREMISACAGLVNFDDKAEWHLDRALSNEDITVQPLLVKGWRALFKHQRERHPGSRSGEKWFRIRKHVAAGECGHDACMAVVEALLPRPLLSKLFHSAGNEERVSSLFWVNYQAPTGANPAEILNTWPRSTEAETELLRALSRSLANCLSEASELEFVNGYDRSSQDVPSVYAHTQNDNRTGFMPQMRLMADLWDRLATRSDECGLSCFSDA